jgi:hypothetical protein
MTPTTPHTTSLGKRLGQAIKHLPETQIDVLEAQGRGGLKACLAAAVGMPSATVLSDMLADRVPGRRYLPALASALLVPSEWLLGDDRFAPDWALSPLDAYERWENRLRAAAIRAGLLHPSQGSAQKAESSVTHTGPSPQFDGNTPYFSLSPVEWQGLINGCPLLTIDLPSQIRLGLGLGLSAPLDPDHLTTGQELARLIHQRVLEAVAQERHYWQRYLMGPRLAGVCRQALMAMRMTMSSFGMSTASIDDCIEILARQSIKTSVENHPPLPPDEFIKVTGRRQWTPLREIHLRHEKRFG